MTGVVWGTRSNLGDRRATPRYVVEAVQDALLGMRITLDVAAEDWSAVAPLHFTKEDDALDRNWGKALSAGECAWMNPPYSQPAKWCAKAATEAQQRGIVVVGLVPDDRSTRWWQDWVEPYASHVWIPDQRLAFVRADTGEPEPGNPRGSALPVWTPWGGPPQERRLPVSEYQKQQPKEAS